jgi:dTDP-4-amino-4,6-dideoxygalactose transaminase
MADTLAAYLTGQLEQAGTIQAKRRRLFETYQAALEEPAAELGLGLPVVPADCDPAWHLFYVLLPDLATRTQVMARLRDEGIQTTFHYVPLHDSEGGRRFSARPVECPVTSDVSSRLLRLPFHNNLSHSDATRVAEALVRATRDAVARGPR